MPLGGSGAGGSSGKGCKDAGCDRRPIYAYKGSKKAAYCARHRWALVIHSRNPPLPFGTAREQLSYVFRA